MELLLPPFVVLAILVTFGFVARRSARAFKFLLLGGCLALALPIIFNLVGISFLNQTANDYAVGLACLGVCVLGACAWRAKSKILAGSSVAIIVLASPVVAVVIMIVESTYHEKPQFVQQDRGNVVCVVTYFPVALGPGWTDSTLYWRPPLLPFLQIRMAQKSRYDLDDYESNELACASLFQSHG